MIAKSPLFALFLCLLNVAVVVEGAVFFKQRRQDPVTRTDSEKNQDESSLHSASDLTSSSLHITMPRRLPKLHEEILFDVPQQSDPLTLRVDRVYEHPETRSSTVCGRIVDTSTGFSQYGGTFTLSCEAPLGSEADATEPLNCLANLRPVNSNSIQYELRQDSLTNAHILQAINRDEVYEPKIVAGDEAVDMLHEKRSSLETAAQITEDESKDASRRLAADTNDILDLFVVWTPEAEAAAGSANSMSLYMDFIVDESNYILESSGVELRLRIVHSMRTLDASYTEPGTSLSDILYQATEYASTGKPEFDTEQSMRYDYKADALVIISGATAGSQCGVAWVKTYDSFPASSTVSVSALKCLSGGGTMMHELGHNLGCTHDLSASTQGTAFKSYSHGYCWDKSTATTCDKTCGRSTMAYSGCVTPMGCSSCNKYDVFSNPDVMIDGSAVGTATLNNARSLNESRIRAVALQDSLEEGGLIFSVEPNRVPLGVSCFEMTIQGWHLGGGSDISSVSVAGVASSEILSQSKHHVTLQVVLVGATAGTGDIVITSGGFETTLSNGFTYDVSSSVTVVEDFETTLNIFSQSDDSVGWYYLDTNCQTSSGGICESYGPASGDGMYALVNVDGSGRDAAFEAEFSSGNCIDTVTALSVKYFAYSVSSFCFDSNFLQLQVQYSLGGEWVTVVGTSNKQSSNTDSWFTLSTSVNSIVYGVKVLAKTFLPNNNCDYWNPVAIDDISVSYSSTCDCSTASPTITYAPSPVPVTISPTTIAERNGDGDDDGLLFGLSGRVLGAVGAAAAMFVLVMCGFCWCDNWRTRRRERMEANRAARLREQELMNQY